MEYVKILLTVVALLVSFLTFYYVRVDKGMVRMTQPSLIYLQSTDSNIQMATVVFAALIYSTADRGHYVEDIFVRLERDESSQNFSGCKYEDHGALREPGFYVDRNGLAGRYHFWAPGYDGPYSILPGEYTLHVVVKCVGEDEMEIGEERLSLSKDLCQAMKERKTGVCFTWSAGGQKYIGHIAADSDMRRLNPNYSTIP
jgi:hypothetical protein